MSEKPVIYSGPESLCAQLRAVEPWDRDVVAILLNAITKKTDFALCVGGTSGSLLCVHNAMDHKTCARFLERFARQQREMLK